MTALLPSAKKGPGLVPAVAVGRGGAGAQGSLPGAWLGPQLAPAGDRAPVTGISCGPIGQQLTKQGLRESWSPPRMCLGRD